jgi:site-specific recombinase XerC
MLSPRKLLRNLWSHRIYVAKIESAAEYYDAQVSAIKDIADTKGYQEIKLYWARVREAALMRLEEIESNDVTARKSVQAELRAARRFLDFLEMMENAQPPLEDTDV